MKRLLFSLFVFVYSLGHGQTTSEPILLDRETISGLNLKRIHPSWAESERKLYTKRIFSGEDIAINVTASNTASHDWKNYSIDEFVCVTNGQAVLTLENGEKLTFTKGDFFLVPKGFNGKWTTVGGGNYFLEIAIMTKKRSKNSRKAKSSELIPFMLNRQKLSGIGARRDSENDVLFDGVELKAEINNYKKSTIEYKNQKLDKFIHVLTGKVKITSKTGKSTTFFTGDFFTLPKGFSGTLEFEGH
ncbi:cupin domain-containing protein, partial [Xanthovirga aplysinae]|uniref:cupin domain-containing protein n=1 Tax=Xanthovirga aplysinae TaxID=2529853 RepID=UPI0012BBA8A8